MWERSTRCDFQVVTRWAPTSWKWSYNLYKWRDMGPYLQQVVVGAYFVGCDFRLLAGPLRQRPSACCPRWQHTGSRTPPALSNKQNKQTKSITGLQSASQCYFLVKDVSSLSCIWSSRRIQQKNPKLHQHRYRCFNFLAFPSFFWSQDHNKACATSVVQLLHFRLTSSFQTCQTLRFPSDKQRLRTHHEFPQGHHGETIRTLLQGHHGLTSHHANETRWNPESYFIEVRGFFIQLYHATNKSHRSQVFFARSGWGPHKNPTISPVCPPSLKANSLGSFSDTPGLWRHETCHFLSAAKGEPNPPTRWNPPSHGGGVPVSLWS